jgi:hypothetical protein
VNNSWGYSIYILDRPYQEREKFFKSQQKISNSAQEQSIHHKACKASTKNFITIHQKAAYKTQFSLFWCHHYLVTTFLEFPQTYLTMCVRGKRTYWYRACGHARTLPWPEVNYTCPPNVVCPGVATYYGRAVWVNGRCPDC